MMGYPGWMWWFEDGRRGIAYPDGRGVMTPLLDGATGDIVSFSKEEQYAACYSAPNEVFFIMEAMDSFDELRVVNG